MSSIRQSMSAKSSRAGLTGRASALQNNRSLLFLLLSLACATWLAFTTRPVPPPRVTVVAARETRAVTALPKPVPTVHQVSIAAVEPDSARQFRRNPFRFADEPQAPAAPPLPLPPPPPPEIRPTARFIGTLDKDGLLALFSSGSDVLALKEGDTLEQRYLIKNIGPESVVLEDREFQTTASFALAMRGSRN